MAHKPVRKISVWGLFFLVLAVPSVFANKSAVSIHAPAETAPGTTIAIRLDVTHKGNSGFHHTNWVTLKINGNEVKRWEYSRKERPEAENFSLTFTQKVDAPVEVVAQSNCNLHGSEGPVSFKVDVKRDSHFRSEKR